MRYRIAFLGGVAVGFVLGTRAGRERYEQIVQISRRVADSPAAQQAAGTFQAQASSMAKTAREKGPKMAGAARSSVPKMAGAAKSAARTSVPRMAGAARDKAAERIPVLRRKDGHHGDGHADGTGAYPYTTTGGTQQYGRGTQYYGRETDY